MTYVSLQFWLSGILISILAASGCATKAIMSQWSNPDYTYSERAAPFKRIMVIGVTDQTAIRRNFEDEFVAELKSAGVDALPSYGFFPESGKVAGARPNEAVQRSRADGVIITRLTGVDQRTEITPGFYDPPAVGIYGWYSSAWYGGLYTPPRVYSYPIFYSETTLHDVAKDEIVWSGTIRTIDPENVNDAIEDYVDTVIEALQRKNLLRS